MQMFFRTPPHALAPFVESIWYCASDNPSLRERILPSGRMELLVNLDEDELRAYHGHDLAQIERMGGAAVCGAWARSFGIDGAEQHRIVGVSFRAGGAAPFFGLPAHAVAEQQAHLIRDFRELADLTPTAYAPVAPRQHNHAVHAA